MAYIDNVLQQLRDERRQAKEQVEKLDSMISVLEELIGRNSTALGDAASVAWFLQLHGDALRRGREHDVPENEHTSN